MQREQRWRQLVWLRKIGAKLISVGVKLKVSLRLSPCRIVGSLLTLVTFYTPCAQMWTATFVEEDSVSMVPLNGSPCGRREDQVGMPSESSHIATRPLKQK